MNDLSYDIKMWAEVSFVFTMHAFDEQTDRRTQTDFDSNTVRMHSQLHGKNH